MYILLCLDGSYYTGSTNNLELRLGQHQAGKGANHTRKRLPVKLIYYEEYSRIDDAFYREKQVQGWSRIKKKHLLTGRRNSYRSWPLRTVILVMVASRASATDSASIDH
ncbi:GIY-YIG nuclease family protein [Kaistella faecalis]|uniref:GIY-YIG nuclease family protein n=1 Tax=Kaistella faecalis TaxID=2852098 RepID=UPI001E5898E3|nr:GIY-YIG nuclease family protein [Chryseobacterium faecale]UFK98617.1 GIY-YIG nuclease family protein [Chryseobacterium faecale]